MSVVDLPGEALDKEISSWPETFVALCVSATCDECARLKPIVEDIAFLRAGMVKICKIDIDAYSDLADKFFIYTPPAILVFRAGRQIARLDGAPIHNNELIQWLDNLHSRNLAEK
ncbi:MAG: thioredoxin family protein [Nitrospiraceae bacterium]|nr:thioredoxin family protein [Nitrospiraceae bacterium]